MCGILGIINHNNKNELINSFSNSLNYLNHRGPDDKQIVSFENNIFGFTRLAIIDLTNNGMQPFEDEKSILVFNGEIYNFLKLKKELQKLNVQFKSSSDGEVLKKYIDQFGIEISLNKIDGMYSFCYFNKQKKETILARDPFGEKPLYYSINNKTLYFSSEIYSLQKLLNEQQNLHYQQIGYFLWKGYNTYENTIYKNIHTVKPNSYLKFENNKTFKYYNELNFSFKNKKTKSEIFSNLIKDTVSSRMISDHDIGCLISGGIDSALIGKYSKDYNHNIKTYSVNYSNQETYFINEVLNTIKSEHKYLNGRIDSLISTVDKIVEIFNEPFGDISSIFTNIIFNKIKDYHRVVLGGDGADELFAGYIDGIFFYWNNFISKVNPIKLKQSNFSNNKMNILYNIIFRNGEELYNNLFFSGWDFNSRSMYFNDNFNKLIESEQIDNIEKQSFLKSGTNNIERYLNSNLEKLSQDFLVKIDRISMHYSVEARSPFLSKNIFYSVNDTKINSHVNFFNRKIVLKKICERYFSKHFTYRKKTGFTFNISEFIKEDLSEIKRVFENSDLINFILKKNYVDKLLNNYDKNSQKIWNLLILNCWAKKNNYEL